MKYRIWLNKWLELYVKQTTRERTYKKYKQQVEKYLVPALGDFQLSALTPIVLQQFVTNLSALGLSANTIRGIVSLLKSSLKRAVQINAVRKEFSLSIVFPKAVEKNVKCFCKEQQKEIESYLSTKNNGRYFGIILTFYTGLRIGELLALTWTDIDLHKGIITVSKSCHDSWHNGKYVKIIDMPKTESSSRIIPIPKQLLPHLKALKWQSKNNYVVDGKTDYGAEVRSYQNTFKLLLKRLRIPHKGFHTIRHTFATRALECGMDVKTLAEILGHKNPTITLKCYAHSMIEHKKEMMNRIGEML